MERIYGPTANELTMAQREPLRTEFVKQEEAVAAKPKFKVKPLIWKPTGNHYNGFTAKAGKSPLVLEFCSDPYQNGNWNLTVITNIDVTVESSCEIINPLGGYASFDEAKAAAEQFIMDAFNDLMDTTDTETN